MAPATTAGNAAVARRAQPAAEAASPVATTAGVPQRLNARSAPSPPATDPAPWAAASTPTVAGLRPMTSDGHLPQGPVPVEHLVPPARPGRGRRRRLGRPQPGDGPGRHQERGHVQRHDGRGASQGEEARAQGRSNQLDALLAGRPLPVDPRQGVGADGRGQQRRLGGVQHHETHPVRGHRHEHEPGAGHPGYQQQRQHDGRGPEVRLHQQRLAAPAVDQRAEHGAEERGRPDAGADEGGEAGVTRQLLDPDAGGQRHRRRPDRRDDRTGDEEPGVAPLVRRGRRAHASTLPGRPLRPPRS